MGRRQALWIGLGVVGLVIVVGIAFFVGTTLARPAATSTAAPTPTPTPIAEPSPSPSPTSAAAAAQDRAQYRAYVSAAIRGGASVAASLAGLERCRDGRPDCVTSLDQASQQVTEMQQNLAANPPPACLEEVNGRLTDALSFQQQGLDLTSGAVESHNRVQLIQGLLLTTAGGWRAGQALADLRVSDC